MSKILLMSGPDKQNGFDKNICKILDENLHNAKQIVCISANIENYEKNDKQVYGSSDSLGIIGMFSKINIIFKEVYLLDNRNINDYDINLIKKADVIYFMGGDPILQNDFVIKNNLLNIIKNTNAFIIGVSAGAMNLAKKTFIPKYELNDKPKFIEGFNFCDITIVPHFNINDKKQIDEIKEYSKINKLIGLPNNSSIYINNDDIEYINDYYIYE